VNLARPVKKALGDWHIVKDLRTLSETVVARWALDLLGKGTTGDELVHLPDVADGLLEGDAVSSLDGLS